jgi:hypothetical protein
MIACLTLLYTEDNKRTFGDSGGVEVIVQVFKDSIKDRNIEKTASIALLQLARLGKSKIL